MIKGPCSMPELEALRYVTTNTSIPVPKVLNTHHYDGDLYIEMEFVRGMDLETAWNRGNLSSDQKRSIIAEVGGFISQLRKLEPPQDGITASASLNAALDYRVGYFPFGPFMTHKGFHSYLRVNLPIEDCGKVIGPDVAECHSRNYRSCFTHADMTPRNIMVYDGRVSAIVDWQFGGWYPEYWEYTKAHYGQPASPEWYDALEIVMERYDDELKAERTLWGRVEEPQLLWIEPQEPDFRSQEPNSLQPLVKVDTY